MKTQIRNLIILSFFTFIGIVNANASVNSDEKNSISGDAVLNINFLNNTDINSAVDYQKEAKLITKLIADVAEAKATKQVIEKNESLAGLLLQTDDTQIENNDEAIDFRAEAQLITKAIADRAEINAIQKLVNEGKYSESR